MTAMESDYDSDPGRFLASAQMPHEDVHPRVAARLAAVGVQAVLDVGGGNGKLARLLAGSPIRCLLIDLSPAMLALAPRPAVRADGCRLPISDSSVDAVTALYTLYHYDEPRAPIAEARRVLRPTGLFVACAPNRNSYPELAGVVPGWRGHPGTAARPDNARVFRVRDQGCVHAGHERPTMGASGACPAVLPESCGEDR